MVFRWLLVTVLMLLPTLHKKFMLSGDTAPQFFNTCEKRNLSHGEEYFFCQIMFDIYCTPCFLWQSCDAVWIFRVAFIDIDWFMHRTFCMLVL